MGEKANFPINIFKKFSQSLTQAHAESTLQINVEFVWPLFCRKRIVQDLLGNFVSGFSKLIWFEILNSFSFSEAFHRLCSMFSFQPNKLRHILKFMSWFIIQHIFAPAYSAGRKTWFSRKLWLSNSKLVISGSFWSILSVPKIMFLVPENEKNETSFKVFFL